MCFKNVCLTKLHMEWISSGVIAGMYVDVDVLYKQWNKNVRQKIFVSNTVAWFGGKLAIHPAYVCNIMISL